MTVPILLVVASLAVFILEVFLVSFGALSVVAVGLGIAAVMLAFKQAALYGWIMIGVLFVGIPLVLRLAFKILPKLPFARGFYLRAPDLTEEERTAAAGSLSDLMGREGEATSLAYELFASNAASTDQTPA